MSRGDGLVNKRKPLSHYELCERTARWIRKKSDVVLFEYQSFASGEHPDVLSFSQRGTTLFEIKTSRADFLNDAKKECRIKHRIKYFPRLHRNHKDVRKWIWGIPRIEEFVQEAPHLGRWRYFVCEYGLIQPEEVGHWGLYWYRGNRFFLKKESASFVRNIHGEINLLAHAFRKYAADADTNILLKPYRRGSDVEKIDRVTGFDDFVEQLGGGSD